MKYNDYRSCSVALKIEKYSIIDKILLKIFIELKSNY